MQVDDVTVIAGTPLEPLSESALVVKLWRAIAKPDRTTHDPSRRSRSMGSIYVIKPGRAGYVIKRLVTAVEVLPETILTCGISTAHLAGISKVFVNADLERLPASPSMTDAVPAGRPPGHDDPIRFSLALPEA